MNVKNIRSKKALKFLGLLISAMIIATVSAQVYRYMYIDGSITVTSAKLIWIEGADAPANTTISGSTVTINFDVEQGTPINFTEALFLKNDNATGSFDYNINVTTAVLSTDFERAYMHIYKNSTGSWVFANTLDLTDDTDYYSSSIDAGHYLRMTFELNATTTGNKPFGITVQYWAP
jgi:hypothetical protein